MAVFKDFFCLKCKKSSRRACANNAPSTGTCDKCQEKTEKSNRKKHFSKLDKLSIEARLRKVEEWQYNYRPPRTSTRDMIF